MSSAREELVWNTILGALIGLVVLLLVGLAGILITGGAGWLLVFPVGGAVVAGVRGWRKRQEQP